MSNFVAVYENEKGEIRVPLVESGKKFYLESEQGKLEDFVPVLKDAALGEVRHVRTIAAELPVPMPYDAQREELLSALDATIRRIPTTDFDPFLNREAKLKRAVNAQFAGTTTDQLAAFVALIDGEKERLAAVRKAAIPPPTFERFALTRTFTGRYFGDLFIETVYQALADRSRSLARLLVPKGNLGASRANSRPQWGVCFEFCYSVVANECESRLNFFKFCASAHTGGGRFLSFHVLPHFKEN
jgi:hypothetical protein